jgi:hypothetical protein
MGYYEKDMSIPTQKKYGAAFFTIGRLVLFFAEYAILFFIAIVMPFNFTDWQFWPLSLLAIFLLKIHDIRAEAAVRVSMRHEEKDV